ncbi:hypothetical protein AMTRI_Chr03g48560 [Amborella trichopoda]|nr:dol-P-Glc:Glc(2)Man(9)GlcNAc(2)-PP-Dol alpha-1,2-glucosyltransferase isoform X2 [Amborella trichopoda]XP_020524785.1 dol-P-Glc:Glc(2)Man(9)GlcNAc(2)-PP-Dol alpha-1,2-glucosyltransferase isoform X2 [Amborella trichopoda]XP_020524786.1 dol-P-Glc:Glc(2)Man(9)GlcNAc(2)-PP-Dol alpha-1,2-glucosyltransferase isoform X2 [Amborella trichopoda]XP_020524787.1 dol-P-Glc:Glc(2)Man(9)GlcNAc(2)-PP-Dol alpha-1,2-glucosyltransferase isoform X2 [Amborella trichopoda]XP_020524788.1 dol-P-Glc:Glc(2)Man(9)GlcNAc|eukprot:XP_020524784.1 dol-P-Glc:Glc(2)Man(9)GlcNAc(2)-PP-Dol alpha-1,2-glucosyltransferase isoform X2 [Amborella trichopoda]
MGRLSIAVVVLLWSLPISILFNYIVPDAYMDEIFHLPQAQKYCNGDFRSWDPMITTLPGLYYLSLAYVGFIYPVMWFAGIASSYGELCTTLILRSMNCALAVICSLLFYCILRHMRPGVDERRATLCTLVVTLYPIHWFFTFLYYTDVASTAAVLAMYLASLKGSYWFSAVFGALAILVRQTNVVWLFFVASTGAISYAESLYEKDNIQYGDCTLSIERYTKFIVRGKSTGLKLRKRKVGGSMNTTTISPTGTYTPSSTSSSSCYGLLCEFWGISMKLWSFKWEVLVAYAPFLVLFAAFGTFVVWNGSLVVGAKEAHTASFHLVQLPYFGLVSAAAMAPVHFNLGQAVILYRAFQKDKFYYLVLGSLALAAGFLSVHFFSIAHPYLLADNRHYTFYIWRKVIHAHWLMKYLLVPLYVYSWFSIFNILGKSRKTIWVLLYFFSCAAVLVPAPLIEFRYYNIPFFFLVLHSPIDDSWKWFIMGIQFVIVNIFTIMMFLFRPFHWEHEQGTQRFLW